MQHREYAHVLTRFAALIIDGLLVIPFWFPIYVLIGRLDADEPILTVGPGLLFLDILFLLIGVVFGLWNTIWRMGTTGQSLGRKFLNISVLDEHGRPIGVGRAIVREIFGRWISAMICYIGYLNAFWDKKKQMWHDKMANCYVYYVDSEKDGGETPENMTPGA